MMWTWRSLQRCPIACALSPRPFKFCIRILHVSLGGTSIESPNGCDVASVGGDESGCGCGGSARGGHAVCGGARSVLCCV
jgi:hypothetical protein